MNKEQLITAAARRMKAAKDEETVYTKWEIAHILPHILDTISETLAQGEEVHLHGFGRFGIKAVNARNAINPRTKESVWVPAKKKIVFHQPPHFEFKVIDNIDKSHVATKEKE